jgi:hypothetical protein
MAARRRATSKRVTAVRGAVADTGHGKVEGTAVDVAEGEAGLDGQRGGGRHVTGEALAMEGGGGLRWRAVVACGGGQLWRR